jgi:GntR family transcriptional regulator/MocR family aminotransferase
LISEISTYLRRVRGIEGREIVVTNGSQEAIFFLAQLLIKPGDSVAVEALGYPPALEALKFAGARLVPVQVDSEGLVVEDLNAN